MPSRPPRAPGWIAATLLLLAPAPSPAQVVRDASLGEAGAVAPGVDELDVGADYLIRADGGLAVGSNLFHSFERFGVGAGEIASFTGQGLAPDALISNVIARVTGEGVSRIDGILRSTLPTADFYLLNPAGVAFGPGATLDVPAGFHASSADHVRLGTDGRFSASAPETSVLTTAPVEAFGFLGADAGPITTAPSGFLSTPGAALALVGGPLEIDGILFTPSGQLDLVSAASAGEVLRGATRWDASALPTLGPVRIEGSADRSLVSVRGSFGGGLSVQAGSLEVRNASLIAENLGFTDSRPIEVRVRGDAVFAADGRIISAITSGGAGSDLLFRADTLELSEGSDFFSDVVAFGFGRAPKLDVEAREVRLTDGAALFAGTRDGFLSDGGAIAVRADALALESGALIQSFTQGFGRSGDVTLEAGTLELRDATLATSSFGSGDAGEIVVRATGDVSASSAGLFADSRVAFGGEAGAIRIAGDHVELREGTVLRANSEGFTDAGRVEIEARRFEIGGGARIETFGRGTGDGGDVTILASQLARIAGDGDGFFVGLPTIDVSAGFLDPDTGDAGRLRVEAPRIEIVDDAIIDANSSAAVPGSLFFVGSDVLLSGVMVESEAGFGPRDVVREGGSQRIRFEADRLTIENSEVALRNFTRVPTPSGRIEIDVAERFTLRAAEVRADGIAVSGAGTIDVRAPFVLVDSAGVLAADAVNVIIDDFSDFRPLIRAGAAGGVFVSGEELVVRGSISARSDSGTFGGDIGIDVDRLVVDGGEITARIASGVNPTNVEDPAGGAVTIRARLVELRNGAAINSSAIDGQFIDFSREEFQPFLGGDIDVSAREVRLSGGSSIASTARGEAEAGSITIDGAREVRVVGSEISTEAEEGGGGELTIEAQHQVRLDAGVLSASVTSGDGGNIRIDPTFVILENGSSIIARAVEGIGGNIEITTDFLFVFPGTEISASSDFGVDGLVQVNAPEVDLAGSLQRLPDAGIDVAGLLQPACAVRSDAAGGRLVLAGRGGTPPAPDGWLAAARSARTTQGRSRTQLGSSNQYVLASCSRPLRSSASR